MTTDTRILELEKENSELKQRIAELEQLIEAQHQRHVSAGAGHGKDVTKMNEQMDILVNLQNEGKSTVEIMEAMNISRSTYFRIKKYQQMITEKMQNNEE